MIEGTDSHIHDFDRCMYGLTTQFGGRYMPIKKPWRIVSWGIKFELHKRCDRRHDHGKCEGRETRITQTYTKQIADIILKTVCRYVSIRFKKSLSNDDDVCSSCMRDRRSAKKTAVSIIYDNDEVSADLMWLTMFHTDGCRIDSNPEYSGYQLKRIQRVTTFATSFSPCTAQRAIGNPNENPRREVRDPRVIGKSQVNQPRLVRDPIGLFCAA